MSKRAFDDNGAGVISYRAWLYGGTPDGNPMHSSPSERYEKSAMTESARFTGPLLCLPRVFVELEAEHANWREEIGRLTDQERQAWELRHVGEALETVTITGVPIGEEVVMNRRGFYRVSGTNKTVEIGGLPVVVWDFKGQEYSVRGLSREEIAERMGATVRQVRRWLVEAKRKLRGER